MRLSRRYSTGHCIGLPAYFLLLLGGLVLEHLRKALCLRPDVQLLGLQDLALQGRLSIAEVALRCGRVFLLLDLLGHGLLVELNLYRSCPIVGAGVDVELAR